jgi:hypothetical protein
MQLRTLDFAGIFERAAAIYARNWPVFIAIAGTAILPVAFAQYAVARWEGPQLDAAAALLAHPERLRTATMPAVPGAAFAAAAVALVFGYVMLSAGLSAIAEAVARRYRGETIALRTCYGPVLRQWASVLALVAMGLIFLIAAYAAVLALAAIPLLLGAAAGASVVNSLAPLVVTAAMLAIAFVLLVVEITGACALCAIAVEERSARNALRITIDRICNRREFGRALLCAFVPAAIALVTATAVDAVALLGPARAPAVYVTLDTVQRILVVPFLGAFLAVYYFDVRLRHEGLDLEARGALEAHDGEPAYAPTAYLSGEERALVKRFIERRDTLMPRRRAEIAARLAQLARERVPPELKKLDDESLLERL